MEYLKNAMSDVMAAMSEASLAGDFDKLEMLLDIGKKLMLCIGDGQKVIVNGAKFPPLDNIEKDLVAQGEIIHAIKSYRGRNDVSLKDAKDIVEFFRHSQKGQ